MSKNDVTGDKLITKNTSDAYRDNWDAIWGKKATYGKSIPEYDEVKKLQQETTERMRKELDK